MPSKPSPFKTTRTVGEKPANPESLFRDLRKNNVQYLWSHQADLLREYHSGYIAASDIALELPTGAGKTLVGLLIGEFRRRANRERIVYLCPTRQLAYQVERQARDYGITAYTLVGAQRDYPADKFAEYERAQAIAITTYSGVFNTNPKINDANTIILDDAHSAEGYISSLWSVEIERSQLYLALIDLLKGTLSTYFLDDMRTSNVSAYVRGEIDCVPLPLLYSRIPAVRSLLDEGLGGTDSHWTWEMIRDNLHACNVYVTWDSFVIRPAIPPTFTHSPFMNATQRVYMSATLGEGGELERSIGILEIKHMAIPPGWDRQSSGRRLILFPNLSLDEDQASTLMSRASSFQPRVLALCPDKLTASKVEEIYSKRPKPPTIFRKNDVEQSMDSFVASSNSVLILTNRYDGIDLPGDACRIEIIFGEPSATNAQERFLLSRLGANELLRDRIRTRIAQALGRCTRNANDYALVLMMGQDLVSFCLKRETQLGLHPEMQAEVEFGIDNSTNQDFSAFMAIIELFLKQSDEWHEAENNIVALRDTKNREIDASVAHLAKAARHEVLFSRSLWMQDYEQAQIRAQEVLDALGGDKLTPYRGWWYYLAGYMAWLRAQANGDSTAQGLATDMFSRAAKCAPSVTWLLGLKMIESPTAPVQQTDDVVAARAVENVYGELQLVPLQSKRFEEQMTQFLALINNDDSSAFERGLYKLGQLLGLSAERPNGNGVPDSLWYQSGNFFLVFEAKSAQKNPDNSIGKEDILQTAGHVNWVRSVKNLGNTDAIIPVLLTSRIKLNADAVHHAEGIYHLGLSEIRELSARVVEMYRLVRALTTTDAPEAVRERIRIEMRERSLTPQDILALMKQRSMSSLEVIK